MSTIHLSSFITTSIYHRL